VVQSKNKTDFEVNKMKRGFQIVSAYQAKGVTLPKRQTKQAAGYDFAAATDFTLPSIWKGNFIKALWKLRRLKAKHHLTEQDFAQIDKTLKPSLVPTGVKAYMQPDEVLILVNRSSGPLKRRLILPNGIGIIDADYYDNPTNEGEIFVQLINYGLFDYHIKKGERIAQGIFVPYLTADQEETPQAERSGGFGSTNK
jgi:dUTP pyrophosphatase